MSLRIGIRAEAQTLRERRSPLIPTHVRELVTERGLDITVEKSSLRVFADGEFHLEGAHLGDDLSSCDIILGLKEIPLDKILAGKIYLFFSHTIKGQAHNLAMLKRLVDLKCTLIDYERIVDHKSRRLVFFGKQAGLAGMVDALWALGQRLKAQGLANPFSGLRPAPQYQCLVEAQEDIRRVAWKIHDKGLPPEITPLVCGIMGYGHTSQGAQEIFDLLPVERVAPAELKSLVLNRNYSSNRAYLAVFKEEDMVEPREGHGEFRLQDYYDHPQNYVSRFERYLPYLTLLMNCVYWEPKYPRFVTVDGLKALYGSRQAPRLRVIGDVSCDVNGAVEATVKAATMAHPVYVYDIKRDRAVDGFHGTGPVVLAVYNLPAEIPLESSVFFSQVLKDFIPPLAAADFSRDFSHCHLPAPIHKAVILFKGEFTPEYLYMKKFVA